MVVAVIGAGGPTGSEVVKRLLAKGESVRAVVRNPAKYASQAPWGSSGDVQVVVGDVTEYDSIKQALQGASGAVIASSSSTYFAPYHVDNLGVGNVANAAKEVGVQHVVLVSSMLVEPHNRWHPVRILLNNIRYSLMDHKLAGEEKLRKSGVSYTVVRPGGLGTGPAGQAQLITGQGDKLRAGYIARSDVAAVCVAALENPAARNVTLEVGTVRGSKGAPAPLPEGLTLDMQLKTLWNDLKPDPLAKK